MTERARTYLQNDIRRGMLLDMGLRLFGERSYDDVSIEDIAREAEISRGLMYHYFGSKKGFYIDVVRHSCGMLVEAVVPAFGGLREATVRDCLHRFFAFAQDQRRAYTTIIHGGLGFDGEVNKIIAQTRETLVDRILEAAPELPRTPLVRNVFHSWLASVETCVLHYLQREDGLAVDHHVHHLGMTFAMHAALMTVNRGLPSSGRWSDELRQAAEVLQLID